ncbi:FtsX-like permease family protein [Providencia burhodogranariea]|uniref:FtsX-like permease family protein n=1 Tax=Providencia burhodogranariea TaxID=516074 RepID=UPI0009FD0638
MLATFSFFLINKIVSNSVNSSIEDISILNTLGMWMPYFCRIFLLEGLFIGIVISCSSLVIAMFFSFLINISLISMPLSTGESYQLFVLWSYEYSSMYIVLLLISSFMASIHPAIKAVKSQHFL